MTEYKYSVADDTADGSVLLTGLHVAIEASTLNGFHGLKREEDVLVVMFDSALSAEDELTLGAIVAAHDADNCPDACSHTVTGDITVDWANGIAQRLLLEANTTVSLQNMQSCAFHTLCIVQGGVGSFTVTWPESVLWPGGNAPVLSTAVDAVDMVWLQFDGQNYYGRFELNFG